MDYPFGRNSLRTDWGKWRVSGCASGRVGGLVSSLPLAPAAVLISVVAGALRPLLPALLVVRRVMLGEGRLCAWTNTFRMRARDGASATRRPARTVESSCRRVTACSRVRAATARRGRGRRCVREGGRGELRPRRRRRRRLMRPLGLALLGRVRVFCWSNDDDESPDGFAEESRWGSALT